MMNTAQKFKLALQQLQSYSDNELIIVDGVTLNVKEELEELDKPVKCKHCGASDKLRIYDHQPLDVQEKPDAEEYGYWLDNEMYVNVACDHCGKEQRLTGDIIYRK